MTPFISATSGKYTLARQALREIQVLPEDDGYFPGNRQLAGLVRMQSVRQKEVGPDLLVLSQKGVVKVNNRHLALGCVAGQRFKEFCKTGGKARISAPWRREITGFGSRNIDRYGQADDRRDAMVAGLDDHGEKIAENGIGIPTPTTDRSSLP
jgi:hypothetical protein